MTQLELVNMAEALRGFAAALELCGNVPKQSFASHVKTAAEINRLWSEHTGEDRMYAEIDALEESLPWGFEEALSTMEDLPVHLRVMSSRLSHYLDGVYFNLQQRNNPNV
jgi:hypothetical protein